MKLQQVISLGVTIAFVGCAHAPPVDRELASMPVDTSTPPSIYEAILDSYRGGKTRALIVDDHTNECMDITLPQFGGWTDTLSAAAKEAAADCTLKSRPFLRLPFSRLQPELRIVPQSRRQLQPSFETPLIFLTRPGFSADSSVAMIEVGWYCGGSLCASTDVYWLRRSAQHWVIYAKWNLSVS